MEKDINLKGYELRSMLQVCGFKQKEFAIFIKKSESFVINSIIYKDYVPLNYIDELKSFLGPEKFDIALNRVRNKLERI